MIDYIARSSYLLQQGHFGADLVYFSGEDSNLTAIFGNNSAGHSSGSTASITSMPMA